MSSGQEESLAAAPDGGACGASHSAGCRHTEKPQAQQTRPTCSCRPVSQLGCSEVSGGVRDGGGIGERALHTGPAMRPCVLLSPCHPSCARGNQHRWNCPINSPWQTPHLRGSWRPLHCPTPAICTQLWCWNGNPHSEGKGSGEAWPHQRGTSPKLEKAKI